jgi:hypothetical protein
MRHTGSHRVVDLCSGAGGPWPTLLPLLSSHLAAPLEVCLTDRYPNTPAWRSLAERFGQQIGYEERPVDARKVPYRLSGFRTLFSGFHHFRPHDAVQILADAAGRRQGIGIFEATERTVPALVGMLAVPIIIALVTPAIRPFRWSRLFWTYLLPAIPLMGLVDGVVSCLRTYTPQELRAMTEPLAGYSWEIGRERSSRSPVPVTYAIGYPRAQ